MKIVTKNNLQRGADLTFLSMFPGVCMCACACVRARARAYSASARLSSVLLDILNPMCCPSSYNVSLSSLAPPVLSGERETLFPPLTFVQPVPGKKQEMVIETSNGKRIFTLTIVEVTATLAGL